MMSNVGQSAEQLRRAARKFNRKAGIAARRAENRELNLRMYAAKQIRIAADHEEALREDKARLITASALRAGGNGRRATIGAALR